MTRLAVLSTDTPHHAYFVRELEKHHTLVSIISETRRAVAPFEISHPFESERELFEIGEFFGGHPTSLVQFKPSLEVDDVNDDITLKNLQKADPEVIVVFGTGLIRPRLIENYSGRIINLHGGDPEEYRGLDSHLWAIYHGDFENLVTTLHHVNSKLDDGSIIGRKRLELPHGTQLHQLRAINTRVCIDLVLDALKKFSQSKTLTGVPQLKKGRYYSFMPSALKEICVKRFQKYTETLK